MWEKWVSENIIIKTTNHKITTSGKHTVKYWMVNPGVVLQNWYWISVVLSQVISVRRKQEINSSQMTQIITENSVQLREICENKKIK